MAVGNKSYFIKLIQPTYRAKSAQSLSCWSTFFVGYKILCQKVYVFEEKERHKINMDGGLFCIFGADK